MIKNIILKLTLLSLLVGIVLVSQNTIAMNNNSMRLIQVCSRGYTDILKRLIENGANIEIKDKHGFTPLIAACYWGRTDIVKLLIENSANIEEQDDDGLTAFDRASQEGHVEITAYLTEVRNELTCFKSNPLQRTNIASKNAYLTMLYKNSIYYIDALQCLTLFEKFKKTDEIKKILKECKFLSCKDKNVMKELRKSGLPLTGNEFDMKSILFLHQKDEKFTDLMIE